ncbi:unnamed protein product, partial [Linum tenue]
EPKASSHFPFFSPLQQRRWAARLSATSFPATAASLPLTSGPSPRLPSARSALMSPSRPKHPNPLQVVGDRVTNQPRAPRGRGRTCTEGSGSLDVDRRGSQNINCLKSWRQTPIKLKLPRKQNSRGHFFLVCVSTVIL